MDFRELFPNAQAMDYDGESITINGKTILLDTLQYNTLTTTPAGERIDEHATDLESVEAIWIDGGSATLTNTPCRTIALIKTCAVHTRGRQRERMDTTTMIVSITAADDAFLIRVKHVNGARITLPETITRSELAHSDEERQLLTPAMLIDTLRALAEHALITSATTAEGTSSPPKIIIKDGSLRTADPYLRKHCMPIAPAHDTSKNMHNTSDSIYALAKTSTLLTNKGRPLTTAIMARAPVPCWTTAIDENTMCVRLHDNATHAFILESATPTDAPTRATKYTRALLRAWSRDAAFIGYPYPLVLADQLARVTNQERDMWRAMLASDATSADALRTESRASDAHDILEHILYGNK